MRRSVGLAAIAAALAGFNAGHARAQSASTTEVPSDGLEVGGRARVLYDTNLLRLDDDVATPAGRSRDDLVTTVAAVARAQVSPSLQRLFIDAEYGRDFHAENEFLNRDRILVDAGWDWRLGTRCSGRALVSFAQAQADLAEQEAIVANRRRIFTTLGGGGCEIGLGFRPSVEVRHRDSENSSSFRRGADFETDAVRAELSYNRTGKTGVAVGYRGEQFTYPNRIDPVTGRRSRINRDAVGARVDARIAVRTTVALFVDHNWLAPDGRPDRFRKWSGGFSATYRPIPRFQVTALAEREVDASYFVAAGFTLRDRAELGARYSISPRTQLGLRTGVERNRYRDRQFAPGASIRSFDRLAFVEASADYRILRNIDLRLDARYDDRITDGAFGTFDGARVAASLRIVL